MAQDPKPHAPQPYPKVLDEQYGYGPGVKAQPAPHPFTPAESPLAGDPTKAMLPNGANRTEILRNSVENADHGNGFVPRREPSYQERNLKCLNLYDSVRDEGATLNGMNVSITMDNTSRGGIFERDQVDANMIPKRSKGCRRSH